MKLERRSLNSLVEEQLSKWQAQKTAKKEAVTEEEPKPMLTISIDPGSGGVEVAKRLAPGLEWISSVTENSSVNLQRVPS